MDCYYHKGTNAIGSCERCNRPICPDCVIHFKHKGRYKQTDELEENKELLFDEDIDRRIEDLNFCLPCYYQHFYPEISDKAKASSLIISSVTEVLIIVLGIYLIVFFLNAQYQVNLMQYIENSGLAQAFLILLTVSLVAIIFIYRKNQSAEDIKRIDAVREIFLTITNIGTIDAPITCFYCKYEISYDALACMNLNCTLGETISSKDKEVPIKPVNTHYGLFDTLTKLPKIPDEKGDEDIQN